LGIGLDSDDVVGPRREFARRFSKQIGKFAGSTPGDKKEDWMTCRKNTVGYPDWRKLGLSLSLWSFKRCNR
ncbi:hypothetical protein BHE74_00023222, partial [Ensete ventricosum]